MACSAGRVAAECMAATVSIPREHCRVSVLTFAHCLHTWVNTSLGQVFERANTSVGQVLEQGCANSKIFGPTPLI
eukprot:3315742-Prymnesium_polylepis.1